MKAKQLFKLSYKQFSVLPKVPKMEITMRTPYRTFFNNHSGFQRLYVNTIKGLMAIQNRTPPVIYLLPAGEIKLTHLTKGEGNKLEQNASGEFMHSGGYVVVHEYTYKVNLFYKIFLNFSIIILVTIP